MAIIATAFIPVKVDKSRIEVIIKAEVNKCGCVSAGSLAIQTGRPADELADILKVLAGKGEISCSDDHSLCCADKEKLESFSARLVKLRSGG